MLGYDVVAYHFIPSYREGGQAVRGLPEYAYNFEGYQFWFSTQDNRDLFIGDPWKYAPAFGGYCAWGIKGETPPWWPWSRKHLGPPATPWEGWAIVDGTLIFNIWASYTDRFLEESNLNMDRAVRRWKSFHGGELKAGPFNTHCLGRGDLENFCMGEQPNPWLEDLPICEQTADGLVGGGIVSPYDQFDDFPNIGTTPFGRKFMVYGATAFGIIFLSCFFFQYRRQRKWNNSIKGIDQDMQKKDIDDEEDKGSESKKQTAGSASSSSEHEP